MIIDPATVNREPTKKRGEKAAGKEGGANHVPHLNGLLGDVLWALRQLYGAIPGVQALPGPRQIGAYLPPRLLLRIAAEALPKVP
jgi:hypothetical protein